MNTYSRNTLISGIFAGAVLITAVFGFSDVLFHTADDVADTTQQSSQFAVQQVTQTANAQNGSCPGYSQELDRDGDCERSGNAFITVVMGTSSSTGVDANCTVSPTSTTPGTSVEFDGSGSSASSTNITAYGWDFGDGNSATTTSDTTNHQYSSTGNYTGSLTVVSADGNTDTATCPEVEVSSQSPQGPTPKCQAYPSNPNEPADFTFNGSASSDPNGTLSSSNFEWEINGTTYNGAVQKFYNKSQGPYNGTLTVTDDEGLSASTNCSVNVGPPTATCDIGDPSEPPADDQPTTATSSWVDITSAESYPGEGTSASFNLDTYQADNCYPTGSDNVYNQGPHTIGVRCYVDITATSTGTVRDEYEVCVQNEPPQADNQNLEMVVNSTLSGSVDATDYDNLNYILTDSPDHAGSFNLDNSGNFEYESTNYYGSDSFSYRVVDDVGAEDSATVDIQIYNNEPKAVIDGAGSLDYCQDDQTKLTYDGSDSNDEQSDADPDVGQDGDAPDLIKPGSWNWNDNQNEGFVVGSQPDEKYRLSGPVDWPNNTTIELQVEDDEGETNNTSKLVTINTPDYQPSIIEPSDNPQRLWITANAQKRSTKATIEVTNINPGGDDYGPSYSFSNLELDFSKTNGIPEDVFDFNRNNANQEFEFWVKPNSESEELEVGTYTVKATVELNPPSFNNGCTYDEQDVTVDIPLRAQTTAEF